MKIKRLNVRLTDKRYEKINLLAKELDRTVSSLIDEWIDSLSTPKTKSHGESIHRWRYIPALKRQGFAPIEMFYKL